MLLGKVLFLQKKAPDSIRILNMVYEKFTKNTIAFCAPEDMERLRVELCFYLGASYIVTGELEKGTKLLKGLKRKYTDIYNINKLLEIAENALKKPPN
jgi:hypothetical protein